MEAGSKPLGEYECEIANFNIVEIIGV
jgi:hypothetical protein